MTGVQTCALPICIESFLSKYSALGITPVVVEPNFTQVRVVSNVTYDQSVTSSTPLDIQNFVLNAIKNFAVNTLGFFGATLSLSRLEEAINTADASILTNDTNLVLTQTFEPALNVTSYNTIAFNNAIKPGSIFSTKFQTPGGRTCVYTDVNPNNNTFTIVQNTINGEVQVNNTTNVVYLADITNPQTPVYTVGGTVNYTAGLIVFSQINIINTASKDRKSTV